MPRVCSPSQKSLDVNQSILYEVGNQQFADYVDANLHLEHINNQKVFILESIFFFAYLIVYVWR
jgi:hypothetical protein